MGKQLRIQSNLLPWNLPQLQNLIKRDPKSYQDEFMQQYQHYKSRLTIFRLRLHEEDKELANVISFMSHVANCFPKECAELPLELIGILQEHAPILHPILRRSFVQALILMRNKNFVKIESLLPLFFQLFKCQDKTLREMIHHHIISDIRAANVKARNNILNKTLQNFMYTMLTESHEIAAKKSLDVMIELYRKNIWNDAKTVNVIATACFSPQPKIMMTALKFFLESHENNQEFGESTEYRDGDSASMNHTDPETTYKDLLHSKKIGKKTKKKERLAKKVLVAIHRKERGKRSSGRFDFSPLQLLNDPQTFTEKLFSKLKQPNEKYEVKIILMSLISRAIATHQLVLLNFYSFVMKYLSPRTKDVTLILAYTAQASHELVPPDVVEPIIRAIANNFVSDHCSNEAISIGLNSIREICKRCPLAMTAPLLQDLSEYKSFKDKSVIMSARSLITLYRTKNPTLLAKKDRGKEASQNLENIVVKEYGQNQVFTQIEGIEHLEYARELQEKQKVEQSLVYDSDEYVDISADAISQDEQQLCSEDESCVKSYDSSEESDVEVENQEDFSEFEDDTDISETSDLSTMNEQHDDGHTIDLDPDGTPRTSNSQSINDSKKISTITGPSLDALKIFSSRDFELLKKLKREQKGLESGSYAPKKSQAGTVQTDYLNESNDSRSSEDEKDSEFVEPSEIETLTGKRKRLSYQERLASIEKGRDGRDKFGSRKRDRRQNNPGMSTTNREKLKSKNFLMSLHSRSIRSKKISSMFTKQLRREVGKKRQIKHSLK